MIAELALKTALKNVEGEKFSNREVFFWGDSPTPLLILHNSGIRFIISFNQNHFEVEVSEDGSWRENTAAKLEFVVNKDNELYNQLNNLFDDLTTWHAIETKQKNNEFENVLKSTFGI